MPVLTFKVSAAEARAIRGKARASRARSVSSFIRAAVLGDKSSPVKVTRKRHPVSGLPYNAAPGRVVSDEEIQAALADFP